MDTLGVSSKSFRGSAFRIDADVFIIVVIPLLKRIHPLGNAPDGVHYFPKGRLVIIRRLPGLAFRAAIVFVGSMPSLLRRVPPVQGA
jgi:hypothetical protein